MRENGVQTLAMWCLGRGCNHHSVFDVSGDEQRIDCIHGPRRPDQRSTALAASLIPRRMVAFRQKQK